MYRSVTGFATWGQAKLETFLSLNFSPKMGIRKSRGLRHLPRLRTMPPRGRRQELGVDEAFIETGQRTAFSYLAKPSTDHLARAFKER